MDAPAVAVSSDGKKIAAAWMDVRSGANNRDVQWTSGAPARLPPESGVHDDPRGLQGHPSLAIAADGTAWCAWEDARGGPNDPRIYARDSKSGKETAVSSPSEGKAGFPALAAAGGLVAVAYEAGGAVAFRILAGR